VLLLVNEEDHSSKNLHIIYSNKDNNVGLEVQIEDLNPPSKYREATNVFGIPPIMRSSSQ
jgi:hypothetical protein